MSPRPRSCTAWRTWKSHGSCRIRQFDTSLAPCRTARRRANEPSRVATRSRVTAPSMRPSWHPTSRGPRSSMWIPSVSRCNRSSRSLADACLTRSLRAHRVVRRLLRSREHPRRPDESDAFGCAPVIHRRTSRCARVHQTWPLLPRAMNGNGPTGAPRWGRPTALSSPGACSISVELRRQTSQRRLWARGHSRSPPH